MHAKTTVTASPHFEEDRIWLNGELQQGKQHDYASFSIFKILAS
jgi:hypothetical protein